MLSDTLELTVAELQARGWLLVEDGNHGEYRPRPDEFGAGEWAFIRAADLDGGVVRFSDAQRINDTARRRIRKGVGAPGDVVLSHKGTVGKVAFVRDDAPPFVCSPQTTFWRSLDLDHIDRRYLYAFLTSRDFQQQLDSRKGETDMAPYVSLTAQRQLTVTLPDIASQRAIGSLLGILDDKIALNGRMNRTLEATAAALFRSWFVDFDPVVANAEGRRAIGVPDEYQRAFPSRLLESGDIVRPEGWGLGTVGEEFDVRMGQSPPGLSYNDEGVGTPFFQGCTDFSFRHPTRRQYTTAPSRMASAGDTLVSVRAPVGRTNMALEDCCIGRGLAAVRHRMEACSYTYYAMRALEERFAVFDAEGTLFGSISRDGFERLPIVVPPQEIVTGFEEVVRPLDERITLNERESQSIATLRDMLLPELLSGSVRLPDAEHAVAAAP